MKTLRRIGSLWLFLSLCWANHASAWEPTWRQIHEAVAAGDLRQLETWVREEGLKSHTAANVLMVCAYNAKRETLDHFLKLGVPINSTNAYGGSALLKAAENGKTEMVQHLLQQGANAAMVTYCEEADCKGHGAIMSAACQKDLDMARLLLEAGANPRVGNDWATEVAHGNGDLELYQLLRHHGGRERQTNSVALTNHTGGVALTSLGLTEMLPNKTRDANSVPNKSGKIRLSVIADNPNVQLGDLLTADLSKEGSLELLERQELERLLAEKKLHRYFAINPANYGQVSELLKADALLLIQDRHLTDRKVIECRLLRVNPGLIVDTVYAERPIVEPAVWVREMGARIRHLTGKVTQTGAIALSLLSIQSSANSVASRSLDRTLAMMLSDRLAHQAPFVVLERAALDRLAKENTENFWTSSYLVDGNVDPALNGSGAFTLTLRFQPTGTGQALTFQAAGQRTNPAPAVDELLTQIQARLAQGAIPQQRDLVEESRRFVQEAHWALSTDQLALAQNAAEAAWALGDRSLGLARLRVQTANLALRDVVRDATKPGSDPQPTACFDLAQHLLAVWRETLEGEALRGQTEETRRWLEFGFTALDGALVAPSQTRKAADQLQYAEPLQRLRETTWEILQTIRRTSANLPGAAPLAEQAVAKQAALVRFVHPSGSSLLPVVRELLTLRFGTNDALVRARIRANLLNSWHSMQVAMQFAPQHSEFRSFPLSRSDALRRQLARVFLDANTPEDRYVAAVIHFGVAHARGAVTQTEIDALCSGLLGIDHLLAEGGEVFAHYFGYFDGLDKCKGVPFFAMKAYEQGNRHWERHLPEHTRFRAKLFLAIVAKAKRPDGQFTRMMNQEDLTAEQQPEIVAAKQTLEALAPPAKPGPPPPQFKTGMTAKQATPGPTAKAGASAQDSPPLPVRRLWHPFNLGLGISPEFTLASGMQWIEDRIWVHGYTVDRGGQPDRHYLFVIHPETLKTETLTLPDIWKTTSATFLVTKARVFVTQPGRLLIFNRAAASWESYPEINPGERNVPLLIGDDVYLSVLESPSGALIRFNLKDRSTEILVSARRRPAISPFDDVNLPITALATNELEELVVSSGKTVQAWSPTKRLWRAYQPPAATPNVAASSGPKYGRVGAVTGTDNGHLLRLRRKNGTTMEIPLVYTLPAQGSLPPSRYHWQVRFSQNIWPAHANSFAGGLLLTPGFHSSGFWIVPQPEIEEYFRLRDGTPKPLESVAN